MWCLDLCIHVVNTWDNGAVGFYHMEKGVKEGLIYGGL